MKHVFTLVAALCAVLGLSAPASAAPNRPMYDTNQLYALSLDHSAVWQRVGMDGWTRIGGPAGAIFAGPQGLFATNPVNGDLFKYNGGTDWFHVGGPGRTFAQTKGGLFGLSPDGSGVYRMVDYDHWTHIGGAAAWIYGGEKLLATSPGSGDVWRWDGLDDWSHIGGPATTAVATPTGYWELHQDGSVYQMGGNRIGGPAKQIYGGPAGLVESSGDTYRYNGTSWGRIFGPSATVAVGANQIFSLTADRSAVYQWTGGGTSIRIGGAFADIAAD
jgi:hypothetical protein